MVKNILVEKNNAFKNMMQLEKLENRQLLATVTGGGEEVGSDISYQGNTYDQVLMQGAAVSVEADPGQIVRVSWIDGNGDITQGEFSGDGTFTVSLDDFVEPAEPENYNQPGVEYASGHASITIEGSNSSSNVSVFTVGPTTAANFGPLDTGADLDGVADIARITIVADPSQPGGSTFGGIRTANTMYSDDTGVVGIAADGVQVQSVVLIGDIDASNSGIPTLLFGDSSQFGTVQIAGGDLAQSNGEAINDGGFQTISFIDGMTSDGVLQPAGVFAGAFQNGEYRVTALDSSTDINIEGLSQDELNAIFTGKTFTEDVTIVGALAPYQVINAGEFQKNVTFDGDFEGAINLGSVGGDIIFMGIATAPETEGVDRTVSSDITAGSLGGSLIFGSETDTGDVNYSGTLMTSSMASGALQVFGDFTGTVTTDADNDDSFDVGEGALGDILVSGDFSGNAVGILGIGNIAVGGTLTSAGAAFYTASNDTPDGNSIGAIGTLTVTGDVDQDAGDMLINITNNGAFGAITLGGGTDVGLISIDGSQLGRFNGAINITAAGDVNVHGIRVSDGALDNLTITGDGEGDLTLGDIEAAAIDNVTVSGFGEISLNAITIEAASGMLDFTGNTTVNEAITVSHQLGALTINGNATINADITSAWMGPVMIDGNATFADGMGLVSGDGSATSGRLVSFEVTGNTTFNSAAGPNIELAAGGDFTFGGSVTGMASGTEIMASNLGDFSFSAALSANGQAVVSDLTVKAIPLGGDGVAMDGSNLGDYSIGNITVESTNTIGIPGSSLVAGNTVFHALGAIGDISLTGGGSLNAQTPLLSADTDKLLFIVGDTSGDPTGAPTVDFDGDGINDDYANLEGGTVSIGNVSINVASAGSDYNTIGFSGDPDATATARFTGMNVLAGVHADADQMNAVNNNLINMAALWADYNTAKDNLAEVLDGDDIDELTAAVTAAEDALGTPDDPATDDVDETSGAYVALAEAQAAVAEAQKGVDAIRTSFNDGLEANATLVETREALGDPGDDPNTEVVEERDGAYAILDTAEEAYDLAEASAIGTQITAANEAKEALEGDPDDDDDAGTLGTLAAAQKTLSDAEANQAAAQRAYATAVAADDGSPTNAQYKAAFVADAKFDYEMLVDKTGDSMDNLGREAYTENAAMAGHSAEAVKDWEALTDDATRLEQGYESYAARSSLTDTTDLANWENLDNNDARMAAGRAAWIADYLDRGSDTDANTAGETGYGRLVTAAQGTFDDDLNNAAKIAQGRAAVAIKAARDADDLLAGLAAEEDADDIATQNSMTEIVAALLGHRDMYVEDVGEATTAIGEAETAVEEDRAELKTADETLASARTTFNGSDEAQTWRDAQAAFATAENDYFEAIVAATGITTEADVAEILADLVPLNDAVDEAQMKVDDAIQAVADAEADLPAGYAAAKADLDAASKALDDAGARGLSDDEILARNDVDLGGTIGDVNIQNSTSLLTATEVGSITDGLGVTIASASAFVAATDVGSVNGIDTLEESRDGVLVGGNDGDLDENELLVYIV